MEDGMTLESTARPDAVYGELRESILGLDVPPGSALTESAVALRFGVSRPTAKLAIERLVSDGLLRREANRAARVPELSRHDIADLFENRALIESAAISRLARGGDIPAVALEAHRALQASTRDDSPFAAYDIAFHRALVTGQPSARLARMHALLMGEIELCIGQVQARHLVGGTEVARQHQGILDAITAGNDLEAARLTREHIEGSRDRLLSQFDTQNN
jgi:DNA-binding GntR family transcriptional regulator